MDSYSYHLGFEESNEYFQTGGFKYNNDEDNQIVHAQPNSQYNLEIQYGEYQDDEYDQQEPLQKEVAQVVNNFVEKQFHQLDEAVEEQKAYESVPNNFDEENDFDNSVQQQYDEFQQIEFDEARTTNKINMKSTQKHQKQYSEPHKVICEQKSEKTKLPEQVETKNLPNYYCRSILKYAKNQNNNYLGDDQIKQEQSKKLLKLDKKLKCCTLKTLRDILEDEEIRSQAKEYFTSFQFLDDLLRSEKQLDIRPPIKYLNKMYSGCLDRSSLNYWKEP